MHGGTSPGAPQGNRNAYKHGLYTAEAIAERQMLRGLLRECKGIMAQTPFLRNNRHQAAVSDDEEDEESALHDRMERIARRLVT